MAPGRPPKGPAANRAKRAHSFKASIPTCLLQSDFAVKAALLSSLLNKWNADFPGAAGQCGGELVGLCSSFRVLVKKVLSADFGVCAGVDCGV